MNGTLLHMQGHQDRMYLSSLRINVCQTIVTDAAVKIQLFAADFPKVIQRLFSD